MMQVYPGDQVPPAKHYGPGIDNGRALVAGALKEHKNTVFVDGNFKRYTPSARDMVIGVIAQKGGDFYKVNLQPYSKPVKLNQMAFENATKKNKPNLVPGDVVYAKVTSAERDVDAEIECYDAKTGKSAGFGQLKEGTVVTVKLGFARQLLFEGHPSLDQLGSRYSFELAIGVNGKVWVKASDVKTTLYIANQILELDSVN